MSEFIQLHILTSYPPSNLNRDDLGRPKTAIFGGTQRLRISSQSLKRAWRTSAAFAGEGVGEHLGVRTREMGESIYDAMIEKGVEKKHADETARRIVAYFGKLPEKPENERDGRQLRQLVHFSVIERRKIDELTDRVAAGGDVKDEEFEGLLTDGRGSVDVALFGRMLADEPAHNIDAATQVAHGITVHKVAVEDDYFTAVDDLNRREEDAGAGHLGVTEFGAGLFYLYCCINCTLLKENLGGDSGLTGKAVRALTRAAATTSPSGKVNSFGSHAYASFVLAERGDKQPRNLSVAFLRDIRDGKDGGGKDGDILTAAITALQETRKRFDRAYGKLWRDEYLVDVPNGGGSLDELLSFVEKS